MHGALAVEDVYMDNPMGFHVRDGGRQLADTVWKDPNRRKKILSYCPELSMIMDMKLERERCPGDDKTGKLVSTSTLKNIKDKTIENEQQEEEAK